MEENGVTTTQSGSLNLKLGVKFKLLDTPLFAGIQRTTAGTFSALCGHRYPERPRKRNVPLVGQATQPVESVARRDDRYGPDRDRNRP